ncbi:MAG: sugar kinase [Candidatus Hydrogenedentota bacterium]|nr:MAG: sugar kinase [Candidatus Hydrogenedentota bacterium]
MGDEEDRKTGDPILVVGSVAFDNVRTPYGEAREALGGAATYFSVAATVRYRPVHLVGVVGEDFPDDVVKRLTERGVDCSGLEQAAGATFRWSGYYEGDMNVAQTEETCLNVFAEFRPKLPETFRKPGYLFLANIDPDLQLDVLQQVERPRVVAADTMNFWIESKKDRVEAVVEAVDVMFINDAEAVQFTGERNLVSAARELLRRGPRAVVIKKGAHGCLLFSGTEVAAIPAVPLETVVDPTGAGDSFGGAFMAAIARRGADARDFRILREAAGYGSVIAAFNCEAFSMERTLALTEEEVEERLEQLRRVAEF